MEYLIPSIFILIVLAPLVIPWGKKLLAYSLSCWLLLWLMFFLQMEQETEPNYEAGIISDGVALGATIFIFACVIAVRGVLQFIFFKVSKKGNHT